jgi:hypothetical protein
MLAQRHLQRLNAPEELTPVTTNARSTAASRTPASLPRMLSVKTQGDQRQNGKRSCTVRYRTFSGESFPSCGYDLLLRCLRLLQHRGPFSHRPPPGINITSSACICLPWYDITFRFCALVMPSPFIASLHSFLHADCRASTRTFAQNG